MGPAQLAALGVFQFADVKLVGGQPVRERDVEICDHIAPAAQRQDDHIRAPPGGDDICPIAAVWDGVACAAVQHIGARTADQDDMPAAACKLNGDGRGGGVQRVVAPPVGQRAIATVGNDVDASGFGSSVDVAGILGVVNRLDPREIAVASGFDTPATARPGPDQGTFTPCALM